MTFSRLVVRAHTDVDWCLYVATCALVEADRERPGTAEHIAALPGVEVVALDLAAALALAQETTWADAHTRYVATPCLERPQGALIASADPARWQKYGHEVLDLSAG